MKERIFIQKAKKHSQLEEFIHRQFRQAKIGDIEVQYTPVVTRIIIHTTTPGLVIGTSGELIKETVILIKEKFKIENPQIDVQKIATPDLNPSIVAQSIASAIEAKVSYKRLGKYNLQRVMNAGAVGCEIVLSGKLSGQRGRRERFVSGYLKKCGHTAEKDVIASFATATVKLGRIGVSVKIMVRQPETVLNLKAAQEAAKQAAEETEKSKEEPEEKKETRKEETLEDVSKIHAAEKKKEGKIEKKKTARSGIKKKKGKTTTKKTTKKKDKKSG